MESEFNMKLHLMLRKGNESFTSLLPLPLSITFPRPSPVPRNGPTHWFYTHKLLYSSKVARNCVRVITCMLFEAAKRPGILK